MAALRQATDRIPVVFAQVGDPVGAGFVESLARPAGNITGFAAQDFGVSPKWLELLKEVAPGVTRVAARDEGRPFGFGDQEPSPSHRKLLRSKADGYSATATDASDWFSQLGLRRAEQTSRG